MIKSLPAKKCKINNLGNKNSPEKEHFCTHETVKKKECYYGLFFVIQWSLAGVIPSFYYAST